MSDMFDEALCALKKLVAIDSVQAAPCNASPFGEGVAKCLQFVADDAKSRGFKVGLGDGYYVWAETGEGDLFGVLGHLDTVPLGGGWHADPLGEIKDGVFYGRGVLDDKGPMTLAFYAVLSLLEEGKKPKRRIRFIWGGNEESGWKCIERYLQREEVPKEGISPDADFPVINCEKGVAHVRLTFAKPKEVVSMKGGERVNVVMPECRAKVRGEIECNLAESVSDGATELVAHGAAAHGSTPFEGVNAGWKMLKTLADFSPECGRLAALLCDHDGSGLGIACRDEKSGALTCNMGIIDTDTKNIIVELDIRHPVDVPRDDILKRLKEVEGVKSVELTAFHDPLYVAPDDELVTALSDAYNACTGESAKPIAIGGATYARALPKAVAFGPVFPGEKSTIHMPDERQSLEKLRKIYDIYRASFERLLFERQGENMQKKKILFVCLGNICRSPMMEYVFRAEAESRGVADMFEAASAGTSGEEAGNPVYPPARRELAAHGICCDGKRARKLTEDDYRRFDLIVTAEERNSRAASRIFGGDPDGKICRLLDFCTRPRDIDDPWWTGDFKTAYNDILEGVTALLDKLTAK